MKKFVICYTNGWMDWMDSKQNKNFRLVSLQYNFVGQLPGRNIGSNCQWDWSQKEYTEKSFQFQLKEDSLLH